MADPFRLPTPFVVSFSGGRTSGYMLRRVLDAFGGTLPDDAAVVFCNTGKERPETLDFVEACSLRWDVPVTWLEYRMDTRGALVTKGKNGQPAIGWHGWQEVNYATASRDGRPFLMLLTVFAAFRALSKGKPPILPNPVQRFCTGEMKTRTTNRYLRSIGWPLDDSTCAVGMRADEPSRLAKLRKQPESDWAAGEPVAPLGKAGVTEADVMAFWSAQPFDLALKQHEGNCDLCFLKQSWKIDAIMRDRPDLADWWVERERETGQVFRRDRKNLAAMLDRSKGPPLPSKGGPDELSVACHCTD